MANLEKLTEQVQAHLAPGETILDSLLGVYECKSLGTNIVRNGALFATGQRVVFYAKKMGGYDLESFPYKHIASLEAGKSISGATIKFIASGNTICVKWIHADPKPFVELVNHHLHGEATPVAAPSAPGDDPSEALRKMKNLLDQDLITQEEYDAKRVEILARM